MVEHLLCKQGVRGSSPLSSIAIDGSAVNRGDSERNMRGGDTPTKTLRNVGDQPGRGEIEAGFMRMQ